MKVDKAFLGAVQSAGWCIDHVFEHEVLARCPRYGCGLHLVLKPKKEIPQACRKGKDLIEVVVPQYESARTFLRERRHALGLNMAEAEECIGLTKDHLAKLESDDAVRMPNIITFIYWANALGYELVLREAGLPSKTLATIAQTRQQAPIRARRESSRRKTLLLSPPSEPPSP